MPKESHENLPLVDFLPKPGPGLRGLLTRLLRPIGHWLLRLRKIERHERNITRRLLDGELPAGASYVREFELEVDFDPAQLEHIPEEGPVIVTANHPLGGHDAMALLALVEQRRPDVKVLANRLLGKMRFLNDAILEVDVLGDSPGANRSTMREVVRFVRDGGALIVLPAGAVSHLNRKSKVVTDDPWTAQIGVLARLTKATIVPAFIGGRNSTLFQMAGLVHPILRTLLLPHELVRSTGMRFPVRIGEPVPPARVAKFESPEDLVEYLRALTYLLADRRSDADDPESSERAMSEEQTSWASIATAPTHSGEELQQELDALGSDARLISQSNLEVWCARAGDIPRLMLEVGRLRESAFRNVGEGSGRA
ncbi:MAG: lysophospholipid acyltransferase family protein, partial [Planctomycetota bacterium]|nr:lysophospholipid acyltransferase family protein [Planctomycetota bacterium]